MYVYLVVQPRMAGQLLHRGGTWSLYIHRSAGDLVPSNFFLSIGYTLPFMHSFVGWLVGWWASDPDSDSEVPEN